MAALICGFMILLGLARTTQSQITVSKVSVRVGTTVSIPCLYNPQYRNHVKYLCEGTPWSTCSFAAKTNQPYQVGRFSVVDDRKTTTLTMTVRNITKKDTGFWCGVEIDRGGDLGEQFRLDPTKKKPALSVPQQSVTGYIGENITILCRCRDCGRVKWCKLGRNCGTGLIDTTQIVIEREKREMSLNMYGLKSEDSGWYWFDSGEYQMPVNLIVTERPIVVSTPRSVTTINVTATSVTGRAEHLALIIPLSLLICLVLAGLLVWSLLSCRQSKIEPIIKMTEEDVIYSEVITKNKSSAEIVTTIESDGDVTYSAVVTSKQQSTSGQFGKKS